ncbi:MAG: four helix bundle protein [Prosthecobacter sp.]|uniref:four helix bundle protein n=1 Tax=Prosthecobacter sp. TaxID=1965333 RepID=UPI003900B285
MSTTTDSKLEFAKAFWDLRVYQKARMLQGEVFKFSKSFPADEKFSLTDQFRRAARSIGAQIAEAWGKRDYIKHFQSKLSDAESENNETQHWIITAVDDGYLAPDLSRPLFQLSLEIGRMLTSMSNKAAEFCPDPLSNKVNEPSPEFFISPDELPTILQTLLTAADSPLSTEH